MNNPILNQCAINICQLASNKLETAAFYHATERSHKALSYQAESDMFTKLAQFLQENNTTAFVRVLSAISTTEGKAYAQQITNYLT